MPNLEAVLGALLADVRRADPAACAAVIAVVGALAIVGFLFFEHVVGLAPCPLCLEQRYAYYFGVPLAIMLWLGAGHGASRKVVLAGLTVLTALMLWEVCLAAYHAGIEWKFWPGPSDCSGPLNDLRGGGGLLNQLDKARVVRCDEAAWRFLGLSLAGWNVPLSLALAALAAWGARGMIMRNKSR